MGLIADARLLIQIRKALKTGDVAMLQLVLGSIARTGLPWATAYLAGLGITIPGLTPSVTVAIAVIAYVGMQGWSLYKNYKAAKK